MFFKSESPELTTFYGQQVTTGSLPWVTVSGLSYMVVNKREIYHQKNPPVENYIPTTVTGGTKLLNNNNIFPIVGGSGISVSFVSEDVDNNGYIQISSVSTSNVPSTPTPPVAGFSVYESVSNQWKSLQFGANLASTITGGIVTISAPGVATSQSVNDALGSYVNSVSPFSTGIELVTKYIKRYYIG